MPRFLAVCLAVAMLAGSAFGGVSLTEVKSAAGRAGWRAGETSVSRLSAQALRNRLGAQLPEGFGEGFAPFEQTSNGRLPSHFDWRDQGGVNFASPILNQANCGSCVAFAVVSTLETQMNIARKTPSSPWAYSTQHLFACGGGGCATGWTPYSALEFLKTTGVPDEACFPYKSGADGADLSCSASCTNSAARSQKIVSYETFLFPSNDAVKQALVKGPLMAVMRVYEDFLFYTGGVYKHVTGALAGGHAVSIVGWDDTDKAWIVRNSWGQDWGEKGYFRIAWDDASGVGNQTFNLVVPDTNGFVALGIRDNEVMKGSVSLPIESTYLGTLSYEYVMEHQGRPVWWGESRPGQRVKLDTMEFEDGVYVLKATAQHSGGTGESQPRTIYILNGEFEGDLSFENLTAGQTVADELELIVNTTSSPIPFTKVAFKARNKATGMVMTRATPHVLPKMKLLWRAQLLENGRYDVWLEGQAGPNASVATNVMEVTVAH